MALLPHSFFPRGTFDVDQWFRPGQHGHSTLDIFDPFDELDTLIGRNLEWLNKPEFLQVQPWLPKVPQKYRIIVDVVGYNPKSIKTEFKDGKLIVTGREENKKHEDDYSIKEFKKVYELPKTAEVEKLVSFVAPHGELVIEVPLKESQSHLNNDLFPRITDTATGGKQVSLNFGVPENILPNEITVNIKDRDLIVKAEHKVEKPDGTSKFFYYKRTTLPENTDFNALKINYDNHQIKVEAPLNLDFKRVKTVPIEWNKQQQASIAPK
jgi:HSP20 family molecular chaperone IbpA